MIIIQDESTAGGSVGVSTLTRRVETAGGYADSEQHQKTYSACDGALDLLKRHSDAVWDPGADRRIVLSDIIVEVAITAEVGLV
jgi:hypothetical protein